MALADYEVSFNGLTIGPTRTYTLFALDGWDEWTAANNNQPLVAGWGALAGGVTVNQRTVILGVQITSVSLYAGEVEAAFRAPPVDEPTELLELRIKSPGEVERWMDCAVTKRSRARSPYTDPSVYRWFVELVAPDPRRYSAGGTVLLNHYLSDTAGLDSTTGSGASLGFDSTAGSGGDLGVDGTGTTASGAQTATNAGNADTYPTLTFATDSATSAWTLYNDTTGDSASFTFGLVVGNSLVADMAAVATGKLGPAVTTNGSPNYGTWDTPRIPFRLAPGNNTLRFVAESGSTGATCTVTFDSAWL